jgi:RimJ/RimL family protein N-acetyltransferase
MSALDEKIFLRAFESGDEEFLIRLRQNNDIFRYTCGNTFFRSSEYSKKLLNDNLFNQSGRMYLLICLKENKEPIGYTSLDEIDHINKKAQWSGIVIDPQFSGKGYATLTAQQILKFSFEELNMNKIYSYILEENVASFKMAQKVGFKNEGQIREDVFKEGKYHNVNICSILKKEYYDNKSDRK